MRGAFLASGRACLADARMFCGNEKIFCEKGAKSFYFF